MEPPNETSFQKLLSQCFTPTEKFEEILSALQAFQVFLTRISFSVNKSDFIYIVCVDLSYIAVGCSEPCQTSKMDHFAKIAAKSRLLLLQNATS